MTTSENKGSIEQVESIGTSLIVRIRSRLLGWGRENYRSFPWRHTDNEWFGLIAEVLLQRTRAANVIPVYESFIKAFPSPADLASAPVEEIERVIYPLGLRWRAPLLKQLGQHISSHGHIPYSLAELEDLPAVGSYIAAAWLSFHKGQRAVIVDSNVVRWLSRLFGLTHDAETRRKRWMVQLADRFTPTENVAEYNYAVLDFTMQICTPGRPRCESCPIGPDLCEYGRIILRDNEEDPPS